MTRGSVMGAAESRDGGRRESKVSVKAKRYSGTPASQPRATMWQAEHVAVKTVGEVARDRDEGMEAWGLSALFGCSNCCNEPRFVA